MFGGGNGRTDAGTFYCNVVLHLKPPFALNRDSGGLRMARTDTVCKLYMNDEHSKHDLNTVTLILLFFLQYIV